MKRWTGLCVGCKREGREVEPRRTHGERALCDDCAARVLPKTGSTTPTPPTAPFTATDVLGRLRENRSDEPDRLREGHALDPMLTSPEWAVRIAGLWGRRAVIGEPFACPIPGHDAEGCEARLWQSPTNGRVSVLDQYATGDKPTHHHKLADVHAQVQVGRAFTLTRSQSALWLWRMAAEVGFLTLPEIVFPIALQDVVSERARTVLDAYRLLLRVRQVVGRLGEVEPVFSRELQHRWIPGLSEHAIRQGWDELRHHGVVHAVGTVTVGNRSATVYLPAPYTSEAGLFDRAERPPLRRVAPADDHLDLGAERVLPDPLADAQRAEPCRCERPEPYTDEDGDLQCHACGHAVRRWVA